MSLDLERLLKDGVITEETFDWFQPLYDKDQAYLQEVRLAAEARKNDPFSHNDDDDDEDDDFSSMGIRKLSNIEGTNFTIRIATDINSTGHGNTVWHASIATCRYLKERFLPKLCGKRTIRSVELGSGTAVPSLFLGHLMEDSEADRPVVCITDAKDYRNIHQIMVSVGMHTTTSEKTQFHVHPHNWGVFPPTTHNDEPQDQPFPRSDFDLVIVSDCIYNPEYHDALLESMSRLLALPNEQSGGTAVLSFSLHGNVEDDSIWEFIETKIPSKMSPIDARWRLSSTCVSVTDNPDNQNIILREGWHMEETMSQLDLAPQGLAQDRWMAYVYEVTWTPVE